MRNNLDNASIALCVLWCGDSRRYDPPVWLRTFLFSVTACTAACGPGSLTVVESPGGVYQPNHGCTLIEATGDCPGPSAALLGNMSTTSSVPQLRFESESNTGMASSTPDTVSSVQVTCKRSFCGTGALSAHADFRWDDSITNDPRRAGTFVHTFDPPIDLIGHTIRFAVSVEGPPVPIHAQVGVVLDFWHWVAWSGVPVTGGWTRIAGVVGPENPLIKLDPAVTSVLVHAINIDVYVPVAPASGTTGSWSGAIYLDEAGW